MSNCAKNSHVSYTGLVEKYIGTAYDNVKRVADEIDNVVRVGDVIASGEWDDVVAALPDLENIVADLDMFRQIYLGVHENDPVVDNQGRELIEGALYFNSVVSTLFTYAVGVWNPPSSSSRNVTVRVVDESMHIGDTTVISGLPGYFVGRNSITVYVNGTLQYSKTTDPINGAYTETSPTSIVFDEIIEVGTTVVIASISVDPAPANNMNGNSYDTLANLHEVWGDEGHKLLITSFDSDNSADAEFSGWFVWDGDKTAAMHNGGTIISPEMGKTVGTEKWYEAPEGNNLRDGCWVRITDTHANVRWFGGASSNRAVATRAFEAAAKLGPAYVPLGTYELVGTVDGTFYALGEVTVTSGNIVINNILS